MAALDSNTEPQVQEMYARRFNVGTPRSDAYKAGYLAHLRRAIEGHFIVAPYDDGTAEADAFHSGIEHARFDMSNTA